MSGEILSFTDFEDILEIQVGLVTMPAAVRVPTWWGWCSPQWGDSSVSKLLSVLVPGVRFTL